MGSRQLLCWSSRGWRAWPDHLYLGHHREDCILIQCIDYRRFDVLALIRRLTLCHRGNVGCCPEGHLDVCGVRPDGKAVCRSDAIPICGCPWQS